MSMSTTAFSLQETERDLAAGILLTRIIYWSKFARIKFGDHKWIVKQAVDWAADTGLAVKQYQRAIAVLRKRGIVITESHLFKNKSHTYCRLTPEFLAKMTTVFGGADTAVEDALVSPGEGNLYSTDDTTYEVTGDITHPNKSGSYIPPVPPAGSLPGSEKEKILKEQKMPKFMHTVEDVVNGKLDPKGKGKMPTILTKCIAEWRDRCAEKTGEFQPNFTGKQLGQMKQFIFGTKDPSFKPVDRIRDVVTDWIGFCEKVQYLFPHVTKSPHQPSFAFFFEHRHVAFNFHKTTGKQTEIVKTEDGTPNALKGLKVFKG
ncbi:hypothetical protein EVB27_017 [Rhizobium phage RHph_TM16]|nr:hypothetical protein EVB27_017 [Rhizobium phage RHph_TM16]